MVISQELLDILACPETKQPLSLASDDLIKSLNHFIGQGHLNNRAGQPVTEAIDGGLVREDKHYLYPIRDDIPIVLIDEAISLAYILPLPELIEMQILTLAEPALVEAINAQIAQGNVTNRGGLRITESIDGGLVIEHQRYLYPIRDDIPIVLIDEAIWLEPFILPLPKLIESLVCPETKQPLTLAEPALVEAINAQIAQGNVTNRGGLRITESIDGGLVREDQRYLYPMRGNIPIIRIDDAISFDPFIFGV